MDRARSSPHVAVSKIPTIRIWRRPTSGRSSEYGALQCVDIVLTHAETGLEGRLLRTGEEFRHRRCTRIIGVQSGKIPSGLDRAGDGIVIVGDR